MKQKRIIQSGIRIMARHKMRSFLMMLGIIIGVTALTVIVTLGKGTETAIMKKIEKLFDASSIIVSDGGSRQMGGGHGEVTTRLTLEDVAALETETGNIRISDPFQMVPGHEVKYKTKHVNTTIFGRSADAPIVWSRGASTGEYFSHGDVERSARVALLGQSVADELFGSSDPVGAQIRIGGIPFRVKGILERMGTDPHGMDRDNEVVIPITTMMRRVMNVDFIMAVKFLVQDPGKMDQTANQIAQILRERHSLNENEADDFNLITPKRVREMVAETTNIFTLLLPLIAGISLLVGGVLVAGLMLISVNERTGEIGLRKAIGARSQDIRLQFLSESTTITAAGGGIGIVLGLAAVLLFTKMMDLPFVLSWQALGVGVIISILVGLVAGVYPASRASALNPVETLRQN